MVPFGPALGSVALLWHKEKAQRKVVLNSVGGASVLGSSGPKRSGSNNQSIMGNMLNVFGQTCFLKGPGMAAGGSVERRIYHLGISMHDPTISESSHYANSLIFRNS